MHVAQTAFVPHILGHQARRVRRRVGREDGVRRRRLVDLVPRCNLDLELLRYGFDGKPGIVQRLFERPCGRRATDFAKASVRHHLRQGLRHVLSIAAARCSARGAKIRTVPPRLANISAIRRPSVPAPITATGTVLDVFEGVGVGHTLHANAYRPRVLRRDRQRLRVCCRAQTRGVVCAKSLVSLSFQWSQGGVFCRWPSIVFGLWIGRRSPRRSTHWTPRSTLWPVCGSMR